MASSLWRRLTAGLSGDMGIDPGTANTLIYLRGSGIVLKEPSVVAIERGSRKALAVGGEAKRMIGRTPGNVITMRPLRSGVIADFEITRTMLRLFLGAVRRERPWLRPRVVAAVPTGATGVERRAVEEAALQSGARSAQLVDEPLAAAIGAGLPVAEPRGSMVVDIGGGTTEVAVISLGGVVAHRCIRVAGDELDEAIIDHVKRHYNVLIGQPTAEAAKIAVGAAVPGVASGSVTIHGRYLPTGQPRNVELTADEVSEALAEPLRSILDAVEGTLALTPPELAADVMQQGIVLTGGSAQLRGLERAVAQRTGVPTMVAEDPITCVARGVGRIVDRPGLLLAPHRRSRGRRTRSARSRA